MRSLTPECLVALRVNRTLLITLRIPGDREQFYAAQTSEALRDMCQIAAVESTESSNGLEDIAVAPLQLTSLVIRNASPKSCPEQEVAGYRDALASIYESAPQMPFKEGMVHQLYIPLCRCILPQTGGRGKAPPTTSNATQTARYHSTCSQSLRT
ncbi:hypothetical protein D9M72_272720 [compost metagenome]